MPGIRPDWGKPKMRRMAKGAPPGLRPFLLSCALLGSGANAVAAEVASPQPLAFRAQARIEVDAAGNLVKVGVIKDLPEPMRQQVAQQLARWTFSLHPREGAEAKTAATWLLLSACAVPAPDGAYSLGLGYHGHGPRIAGGGPWAITPAMGSVVSRYKLTGSVDVHFVVHPDGKSSLESVDGLDDSRGSQLLRTEIEHMVELNHFEPEQIDGRPVATRQILTLRYGPGERSRSYEFHWRASILGSEQCMTARAAGVESEAGLPIETVDPVIDVDPVF